MSAREHGPGGLEHAGGYAERVCRGCGELWPCEVVRLREDLRLLNEGNHELLRAGGEQRAEIQRLREAVSSLQLARAQAELEREAGRAEARRLAAERDTVRNLYERGAAELAEVREDLRNTTTAWNGAIDLVERLTGDGVRLRREVADFLGWARSDAATKSASLWEGRLDGLEAAITEERAIPHVVLPIEEFAELVEAFGDTARIPRLATYLLAGLDRSRRAAPGPEAEGDAR